MQYRIWVVGHLENRVWVLSKITIKKMGRWGQPGLLEQRQEIRDFKLCIFFKPTPVLNLVSTHTEPFCIHFAWVNFYQQQWLLGRNCCSHTFTITYSMHCDWTRCIETIAHFQYIKYSASFRGWDAVKLNTKEILSYSLGSQCNFFCFSIPATDWS
jgi:hypothetical protein